MSTQGVFGYIIGKKKCMMNVQQDADLFWQVLVREIYVLMKHYGSKELLTEAFKKIKTTKGLPKPSEIEKCKYFTDFELFNDERINRWYGLLRFCHSSFINLLEAGYILNEKEESGYIFMLDFNKGIATYYTRDYSNKIKELNKATIEEIMEFEEMPTTSYTNIVSDMKENFKDFYDKYTKVQTEIEKLTNLLVRTKQQGDVNIEEKVQKLLYDMKLEERKLNHSRRVFYHRLQALDLIEDTNEE